MRRFVVFSLSLLALAAPAAAPALREAPGDGTLVVKNGSAPKGTPVVAMQITGAAIGYVDNGRIVIDDPTPNDGVSPQVTGLNVWCRDSTLIDTARVCGSSTGFKFRAVGGRYTILIYGSGVDVVAVGTGRATIAGDPDHPGADGRYSLNGKEFVSLPGIPKQVVIATQPGQSG